MADLGRGAKGLAALGLLAAGVAAGALAERLATRRLHAGEFVGIESATGITHEVVTDDGVALHVVEEVDDAPAGSPTVIFTHGYGLSLDSWPGQREALRGVARVVLWDQRGHGEIGRAHV